MSAKVKVVTVADVATLQAARADLPVATPLIPAGHPNEALMAVHLNLAQDALSRGQALDAVGYANFLSATKNWRP